MEEYTATLNRVLDGETIDLNVDLGDSQIEVKRIRLKGIQTENMFKQYRTGLKGADGVFAKLKVDEWFYIRSENLTLQADIIEICGRWLGTIFAEDDETSLNQYLIDNYYRNDDWLIDNQENLKDDWFAGESVRVPQGDLLPIFHIWGKPVFKGFRSNCL